MKKSGKNSLHFSPILVYFLFNSFDSLCILSLFVFFPDIAISNTVLMQVNPIKNNVTSVIFLSPLCHIQQQFYSQNCQHTCQHSHQHKPHFLHLPSSTHLPTALYSGIRHQSQKLFVLFPFMAIQIQIIGFIFHCHNLLVPIIISRNLQPSKIKTFRSLFL